MQNNRVTKIVRLNVKYATHRKINEKLQQLNPSYYRSQNEFMIQAMLYYIEALESGKEVTKVPMVIDKPFIKEEQVEHNKFRAEFTSKSFLNDK